MMIERRGFRSRHAAACGAALGVLAAAALPALAQQSQDPDEPPPPVEAPGEVAELPDMPSEDPPGGELFDNEGLRSRPWEVESRGAGGLASTGSFVVPSGERGESGPGGLLASYESPVQFGASANVGVSSQSTSGSLGGSDSDGLRSNAGLSLSLRNDRGGLPGIDYDFGYRLGATADEGFWSDPRLSHGLDAGIAHQGVHTVTSLRTSYSYSDGDTDSGELFDREIRLSENTRWSINGSISRSLARGSLELGLGTSTTESGNSPAAPPTGGEPAAGAADAGAAGSALNDSTSRFADLAWFFMPPGAAKTSLGLGLNVGSSETQTSPDQSWWEPSVRWRYPMSERVDFNALLGYNIRSAEGVPDDSKALTYNGGIDWRPVDGTSFALEIYREVSSSLISFSENTIDSGVGLSVSKQLAGRFNLSANVRYENSEFMAVGTGLEESTDRDDQFLSFGVSLSRAFQFERVTMTTSVFYDYSNTDSNVESQGYKRQSGGISFGFAR